MVGRQPYQGCWVVKRQAAEEFGWSDDKCDRDLDGQMTSATGIWMVR